MVKALCVTVRRMSRSYLRLPKLNCALKRCSARPMKPFCTWFSCSLVRMSAQSAGVSVSATKPENRMLEAIVMENCR